MHALDHDRLRNSPCAIPRSAISSREAADFQRVKLRPTAAGSLFRGRALSRPALRMPPQTSQIVAQRPRTRCTTRRKTAAGRRDSRAGHLSRQTMSTRGPDAASSSLCNARASSPHNANVSVSNWGVRVRNRGLISASTATPIAVRSSAAIESWPRRVRPWMTSAGIAGCWIASAKSSSSTTRSSRRY